jgi:hypothetical protein
MPLKPVDLIAAPPVENRTAAPIASSRASRAGSVVAGTVPPRGAYARTAPM